MTRRERAERALEEHMEESARQRGADKHRRPPKPRQAYDPYDELSD